MSSFDLCFNWDSSLPNCNCSLAYTLHTWPLFYSHSLGKSLTLIAFNSSLTCCLHVPSKTQLEKNIPSCWLVSLYIHDHNPSWVQELPGSLLIFPGCIKSPVLLFSHVTFHAFSPLLSHPNLELIFLFPVSWRREKPQCSSPLHHSPCIYNHVLCLCSFFSGWAVYVPPRVPRLNLLLRK